MLHAASYLPIYGFNLKAFRCVYYDYFKHVNRKIWGSTSECGQCRHFGGAYSLLPDYYGLYQLRYDS